MVICRSGRHTFTGWWYITILRITSYNVCYTKLLRDIQPITLARLIDQLAQAELVERRSDPSDRRAYQLFLKPSAAPHLVAIAEVAAGIQADALVITSYSIHYTKLYDIRNYRHL